MAQELKHRVLIWKGIYGFKLYLPSLGKLRQLDHSDELKTETQWVFDFKKKGKHAAEVKALCESLAAELSCDKIVAIPPSKPSDQPNQLQRLFGANISRIRNVETRKYNHNKPLPDDYGGSYIITGITKGEKILLVDDICTTGRTIVHFKERLESFGFEVKPACLAFYYRLEPNEAEDITLKVNHKDSEPSIAGKDTFKNTLEVYEYLKNEWKVSKSTIYNHVKKEGKLRPEKDGTFSLKAVQKYARTWLRPKELTLKLDDEELRRTREKLELAFREEQVKIAKLKRQREEGLLIPRADFELELAARAGVLMAGFEAMIHEKAGEIIELVGGDTSKLPNLIRFLHDAYGELMNEYASTREFHVMFTDG
ncbi:MAG: phosphoribosyltransferase [Deltaproteobacteria bacterium]|nr:phosphoribosyltransferase [Deltaproteobacteria bacterium]MBW2124209.1 phosphoribosyltransferase [Deltaproteobacteria bacterium]